MPDLVSFTAEGNLAVISINNPPVNALSPGVPGGITEAIRRATSDPSIDALILIGAGRTFIAGADIREFQQMASGRKEARVGLHPLMLALEDCPKPTVCAIHGSALGGGLEVAMACHYRLAAASAQLGQPEVRLGLIPGAGGTQRLPRLAGVSKALEMIVRGNPIGAQEALRTGIIDCVVPGDLLQGATAWTHDLLSRGEIVRRTRELTSKLGDEVANKPLFAAARREAADSAPGQLAPLKAVDAVEAATRLPFEAGCRREEELFLECLVSDQSVALIHVFFAERDFAKVPESARPACQAASDRLSARFLLEARCLMEEGNHPADIEKALLSFGIRNDRVRAAGQSSTGTGSRGSLHADQGEVVERMVYALVNEGAWVLDGRALSRAAHIDVLCIRDCGFPAWRGGPMRYADAVGLAAVYRRICSFRERYGERWMPASLLERLAVGGGSFAGHDAG